MAARLRLWTYRFLPPFVWMSGIFYLSSLQTLPSADVIWWDFIFKKSAHMTEYAILYGLWVRALRLQYPRLKKVYMVAFIICIAYAISDELHQSLTPGRHPKITDIGFDTLGMMTTWLLMNKAV